MLNVSAPCSKPSPLAFCERFRRGYPGNPPVLEGKIFGIGFSVAPIGEQADNLEAVRRAATYQDGHGHVIATVLGRLRNAWRALGQLFAATCVR
jgi:hypothetical protein